MQLLIYGSLGNEVLEFNGDFSVVREWTSMHAREGRESIIVGLYPDHVKPKRAIATLTDGFPVGKSRTINVTVNLQVDVEEVSFEEFILWLLKVSREGAEKKIDFYLLMVTSLQLL